VATSYPGKLATFHRQWARRIFSTHTGGEGTVLLHVRVTNISPIINCFNLLVLAAQPLLDGARALRRACGQQEVCIAKWLYIFVMVIAGSVQPEGAPLVTRYSTTSILDACVAGTLLTLRQWWPHLRWPPPTRTTTPLPSFPTVSVEHASRSKHLDQHYMRHMA
jgi:hypothetical protein